MHHGRTCILARAGLYVKQRISIRAGGDKDVNAIDNQPSVASPSHSSKATGVIVVTREPSLFCSMFEVVKSSPVFFQFFPPSINFSSREKQRRIHLRNKKHKTCCRLSRRRIIPLNCVADAGISIPYIPHLPES